MSAQDLMYASELEAEYKILASTWRYWDYTGTGPRSVKLGRRRVWKRSEVVAWLAEQGLTVS